MKKNIRYGISAGAILIDEQERLLLVHHFKEGEYNFWVPPGGSLEGNESIYDCARREVLEETGLQVDLDQIMYIQEFWEPDYHFVKFFILGKAINGAITLQNKDVEEDFLIDAGYFSQAEIQKLNVYPPILKEQFWIDYQAGDLQTKYLGIEEIRF